MSKHHRISHCDSEYTMKIEKEKMAEVRKEEEKMVEVRKEEEEKMANKFKCHEKCCGK
ncbi:hypothetical protein [Clostridium sp.]|uniref:hypothetical protein n=1 Tax=Clostridium sp. TaxID=1506 RepID=UPI0026124BFA